MNPLLSEADDELKKQPVSWLLGLLNGNIGPVLPPDFGDPSTYLVACLDPVKHRELAQRIGDAAHEALQQTTTTARSDSKSSLLKQLLFLLEALPLTDAQAGVQTLSRILQDEGYRRWPSKDEDIHRSALLALASQLGRSPKTPQQWHAFLQRDLRDSAYAVAAMSALLKQSVDATSEELPSVLEILRRDHIPATDLLRRVVRSLGKDGALWEKLAWQFRHAPESAKSELEMVCKKLRVPGLGQSIRRTRLAPPEVGRGRCGTFMARKEELARRWYVIDASGLVVGRLAVAIATILRGKHRPEFTPHVDTGEYVIVTNVDRLVFTGKKWTTKRYKAYSGYPGGLKIRTAEELRRKKPELILFKAVERMLPRNRLARKQLKKLRIYAGSQHPHQAQKTAAVPA